MYTENDRCLLTDRQRYTPAIAIAVVRHNDLPGPPLVMRQVLTAVPVQDAHLTHPPRRQVVGQMEAPVVACPPSWWRQLASTRKM